MNVVFLGGPLDGELREVALGCAEGSCDHPELRAHPEYEPYWFSNGIARHESVSEEEVARLVFRLNNASRRLVTNPGGASMPEGWECIAPFDWQAAIIANEGTGLPRKNGKGTLTDEPAG